MRIPTIFFFLPRAPCCHFGVYLNLWPFKRVPPTQLQSAMQNQNKPWLVGFGRCNIRLKNKKSFLPLPDIFPSEKPQNNRGIFLFLNYSTVLNLILIPSCALDIALLAVHVCFVIKKNSSLPSGFSVLCSYLDMIRAQSGVLWHLLAFIKVWKQNKSCSSFPASGCMEHFFPWNSNVSPKSFHQICCIWRNDPYPRQLRQNIIRCRQVSLRRCDKKEKPSFVALRGRRCCQLVHKHNRSQAPSIHLCHCIRPVLPNSPMKSSSN